MSDTTGMKSAITGRNLVEETSEALNWSEGARHLAQADGYWLSTIRPDGRPHVMPVLAVWANDTMHFCAGASTQKVRNLAGDPRCVLTAKSGGFDLVLEGTTQRVTDEMTLTRIAEAYDVKYGWQVTVRDGAFHDTEGAPTAGPPPYDVYAILPDAAFAFGTREETMKMSTRWIFSD